ncbi:transposase [Acetobacterium carbinolicum]|uniref:transposase n=1 Tax=Acetobacterium TaxID=33951 RepID=UPI00210FC5ED|nr:transposase [Acetobacterium sp. KB-1]
MILNPSPEPVAPSSGLGGTHHQINWHCSHNCYKIERRFATMVRNHGLQRCRYVRLRGAKIHITMANLACNIARMVSLLLRK